MINFVDYQGYGAQINNGFIYGIAIVSALAILAFYLLRSFGIYTLAKRNGIKNAYLAFIPCLWVYLVCKLIGNARFFIGSFSKLAVLICAVFTLGEVLVFVYNFINYFPLIMYFLQGGTITILEAEEQLLINTANDFVNLFDVPAVNVISMIIYYLNVPLELAGIVITVFLYINLFKKFWPEHYILASVLSIMGLFAPFAFAIRKKSAVDFNEYMRQKFNRYNNPYGSHPYGRDRNPYDNQNTQNYNNYRRPEEPFSEFDKGEPFGEFSDKDKKD